MCSIKCFFSDIFRLNDLSQYAHANNLTLEWVSECFLRLLLRENDSSASSRDIVIVVVVVVVVSVLVNNGDAV